MSACGQCFTNCSSAQGSVEELNRGDWGKWIASIMLLRAGKEQR